MCVFIAVSVAGYRGDVTQPFRECRRFRARTGHSNMSSDVVVAVTGYTVR